jgi:hypothetical protein
VLLKGSWGANIDRSSTCRPDLGPWKGVGELELSAGGFVS